MPPRKIMTLHAPLSAGITARILNPVTDMMEAFGFRWWISTPNPPDITLMIETPEEWLDRGPTFNELAHFQELWDAGNIKEARAFAQVGLPPEER